MIANVNLYEIENEDTKFSLIQKEVNFKNKVSSIYFKCDPLVSLETKKKNYKKFVKDVEKYYNS